MSVATPASGILNSPRQLTAPSTTAGMWLCDSAPPFQTAGCPPRPDPRLNLVRLCRPNHASPRFPAREPTEPLSHSEGLVRLPPRRLRRQVSAAAVHPSSTQRPPVGEQSRPSPQVRFSGTQKTCGFGSRLSTLVHSSVQVPAPDTEDVPGMPGTGPSVQTEAACPADIQGLPRGPRGWHLAARAPQLPQGWPRSRSTCPGPAECHCPRGREQSPASTQGTGTEVGARHVCHRGPSAGPKELGKPQAERETRRGGAGAARRRHSSSNCF